MWTPDYYSSSWVSKGNRFWSGAFHPMMFNVPLSVVLCGYSLWKREHSCERRRSSVFSIELVTGGDAWFFQNGARYCVKPGQVFLVHKGKHNRFAPGPSGFLHKRLLVIEGVMLEVMLQSLGLLDIDVIPCKDSRALAALFKKTNRIAHAGKVNNPEKASWEQSLPAYEILLSLSRSLSHASMPPQMRDAVAYMMRNIDKPLTLKQIADAGGLSIFHFSRFFSKVFHCPPIAYFIRQRMRLAQNLLRNSEMLIKEISGILGYDDPLYFSAQFKKYTGVSPRQFRRKNAPQK